MMSTRKAVRSGKRFPILLLVVFALTSPAALAQADEEGQAGDIDLADIPDVPAPGIDDPISNAELVDLTTLASQKGISVEAAIDRYGWNDNFAIAAEIVRKEFPAAFSGAAIVANQSAWIAFTADAPEGANEIVKDFEQTHSGVSVEVRNDFGFTEDEIQNAIVAVHYSILAAPGVRDATTSFDYETLRITTVVSLDRDAGAASLEDLQARATDEVLDSGLAKLLDSVSLVVLESNLPALGVRTSDTEHIGGEDLSGCTSGFTVKSTSGTNGVATAGHCDNAQSDDGFALTYKAGHEGQYGDFQWHTGPQPKPDDFYAGNATTWEVDRRDVAAVGGPIVGQSLCKNGYAGFKDCGEVIQLNVCHFSLCNLVEMDARTTVPGDSGGPFYWGNTAYGFMYGWRYDPVWPYDRDLFSRADRITQALGVFVKGG